MEIYQQRFGESCLATGGNDCCGDLWKPTAVVGVPMGKENCFDFGQIDGKPFRIGQPDVWIRPYIEQNGMFLFSPFSRDQRRETVASAAKMLENGLAFVPIEIMNRRHTRQEIRDLGNLGHILVYARKGIRLVINNNQEAKFI